MSGYVAISGNINNVTPGVNAIGPLTIQASTANYLAIVAVNLLNGANTVSVPTWAVGAIIQPPTSNAVALTLKGVTGDTGIAISPVAPFVLTFPSTPPASIVITAASLTTGDTQITFF